MRAQRRRLSRAAQRHAAQRLQRHLLRNPRVQRARHLALYLPHDSEISLVPTLEKLWRRGRACYLPRLVSRTGTLRFARYTRGMRMKKNRYGIPEPCARAAHCIPLHRLHVVLTPLVAFDAQGQRLGMGGGFYDRTFSSLRRRTLHRRPHLIGIAYAWQHVPSLAQEAWDIPLDAICTEKGWWRLAR